MPEKFTVFILKFEQCNLTIQLCVPKDADGMANSVVLDQTAPCPDLSVRIQYLESLQYYNV